MTVMAAEVGRSKTREVPRAAGFRVEVTGDWKHAAACWKTVAPSTPFQDTRWLDAWYDAFADADDVEPLVAVILNARTSARVALLPLVRRTVNGIRVVEFADLDLTDYNAPLLGEASPRDIDGARAMWRDVLAALRRVPGGVDLLRLRKMPFDLGGRPNPLTLLDEAHLSTLNGNVVTIGDDFDAYRHSLERTVRKELERSWRVFTRDAGAALHIATGELDALRLLGTMETQQGARMQRLGLNFVLNDDTCATFYRGLVRRNLGSGYVVLSALTVGNEVVATLLGIRSGPRYVMVRVSNAGEKWSNCSPGRLIIERTMAALHRDGVRHFDFSIGNYAYKRRFGVKPVVLADITKALSWRGIPFALRDAAARKLRRYPWLAAKVGRALGKPHSREESHVKGVAP